MTKTVTICFRTTSELRKALEKVSKEGKRPVSSTIENILQQYLEERKEFKRAEEEKRRYPRKKVTAPALISQLGPNVSTPRAGIVLDISLGGLQVSIPSDYKFEIKEDKAHSRISVVFTLPEVRELLTMQCVPKHVYHSDGGTTIGVSFCDTDFTCYQTLQGYLIN